MMLVQVKSVVTGIYTGSLSAGLFQIATVVTGIYTGSLSAGLFQIATDPTQVSLVHMLGLMGVGGIAGAAGAVLVIGGYKEKVDRHDRQLEKVADADAINARLERIEGQLNMLLQQRINHSS